MSKELKDKILSFLGICGCVSCYVAMFPAILLGIVGIFGVSNSATLSALNIYMGSAFFQPILILSILFLIAGILRYGIQATILSVLGGLGIFASMNFYMKEWLFVFSFVFIAFAYLLAFRRAKVPQLKFALIFLLAVVMLGIIDITRSVASAPASMDMMNMP